MTEQVEIALALMTDRCVVGGWAAAWLQGNRWVAPAGAEDLRPVLLHCEPGSRVRRRPCVLPFRGLLHPDEWSVLDGVALASLSRAAFDEMRMAPSLREAVVVADMLLSTTSGAPHTSRAALERTIAAHHKVRGLVQARRALELASTRSASPLETRARLVARDAGILRPLVNVPVFSPRGDLLAVVDLLDPTTGLVVECDGSQHREALAHAEDNRREERLERAGLVVVRVSAVDLRAPWQLVGRIQDAQRDATQGTRRDWTLEQPVWWPTWTHARRWL